MSMDDHRKPDGSYNGVTALAELTGLGQTDILSIAKAVRANVQRLGACPYHEFEPIPDGQATFRTHAYRCIHCKGEIDRVAYAWHQDGRRPKPTAPVTAKDNM